MLERLDDHVVVGVLDHLLAIGLVLAGLLRLEVRPQRADHVHVQSRDVVVVVPDVLVLLVVLLLELLDRAVFLCFDLGDLSLALRLHVFSKTSHFRLVLFLDLTGDALVLLSLLSRQCVVVLRQSVTVFSLTDLLLLFLDFERTQVLLQLALVNAVLILAVLELDLSLLLDHGLLVEVLEHEMLEPLTPDLDRDRVLLLQVLMLAILVSQLSLLVLQLFLGDEPEVVDSQTLVVVLTRGNLFLLDQALERAALIAHRLLVLLVVVVVDGVSAGEGVSVRVFGCGSLCWLTFGRHTSCQ